MRWGGAAASKRLIQYLCFYANTNVFSAALTPQVTGSVLKALELIKSKPELRIKLWDNVNYLRNELNQAGFDIGPSVTPIFPLMIRDNKKVYEVAKFLQENGIFTIEIAYPAVRIREARLRISVLASHEKEQPDKLAYTLILARKTIGPF